MLVRQCREPGCDYLGPALERGRCPEHAAALLAREARRRALKPQRKVWDSARWQRTRAIVKRRAGYRCVDCGRHRSELRQKERLLADHVPGLREILAEGGDPYDPDRCVCRCSRCSGRRDGARSRR